MNHVNNPILNNERLKAIFLTLLVVFLVSASFGQSTLSAGFSMYHHKPKGGLQYSEPLANNTRRISLGLALFDSCNVGLSLQFATGNKYMMFNNPLFAKCADADGNVYPCLNADKPPQGFIFPYYELFAGASLKGGRFFRLCIGPYATFNSAKNKQYAFTLDPRFYFPNTLNDIYKRLEFGSQFQLQLILPMGKHFLLCANGSLGSSFNDLRKNKWQDAKTLLLGSNNEYVNLRSDKVSNRFYSFGLGIGYSW